MSSTNTRSPILENDISDLGVAPRGQTGNLVEHGGLLGFAANYNNIDANMPMVLNPTALILLQAPTMFDNMPRLLNILKNFVENAPKQVQNIDFEYALETAKTPIGRDGQELSVPTRATRSQVNPTFTMNEVNNNLYWNFIRLWINNITHVDTNASYTDLIQAGMDIPPHVFSTFSMSMMAIQFDVTMTADRMIDAAFYTCMFPTNTTPLGLERTINNTKTQERSFPFTGIVKHNDVTRELGYKIAEMLQAHTINYHRTPIGRDDISSNLRSLGIEQELEELQNLSA